MTNSYSNKIHGTSGQVLIDTMPSRKEPDAPQMVSLVIHFARFAWLTPDQARYVADALRNAAMVAEMADMEKRESGE